MSRSIRRRAGRVVAKAHVEDHLYGLSGDVRSNAVEVAVHRLRKQLADVQATIHIHTVRGVGYLISEERP
jgi:DNA-binding response OmpR family regulator